MESVNSENEMKADLSFTKKWTLLSERTIEKQCWGNAQYSRRECLEISGIPSSVSDKDLKDVVCKEIMKVGVEMSDRSIEDCHQVGKSVRPFLSFPKGRWQSKF